MDFGKIIIYTSNLRIIRAPPKRPEMLRQHSLPSVDMEGYPKARERTSKRKTKALPSQEGVEKEEKKIGDTETEVMIRAVIILLVRSGFMNPI